MAERKAQGRVKLVKQPERKDEAKEPIWNRSQEEVVGTPEGYKFTEEVTGSQADNLIAEDAPKARVEGQVYQTPTLDLSPDSLSLANLCLGISNSFVVVMFGQECALYDGEKKLLYPSLSRVINRMPASSAAKASVFIDPLVLLFGIAVWGNRIISIKTKQRNDANTITAQEFARASGVNWEAVPGQSPPVNEASIPEIRPSGSRDNSAVPEAGPPTVNANGTVGGIPDAIINSRDTDITRGSE